MKKKPTLLEVLMSTALGMFCLGVWTVILTIVGVLSWTILGVIFYFKTQILTVSLGLVLFFGFIFLVCTIIELVREWYNGKKN